jgi:hypothetical protein
MPTYIELLLGFIANLFVVVVIVRLIYYPKRRNQNYIFAFFALNTIVYFVMGLLSSFDIGLGAGFGLFAIFSILRYRTDTIPIREMTYLFVLIALPTANSILIKNSLFDEFFISNLFVVSVLYVLEGGWGFQYETYKLITYERIELIRPENWDLLLQDLRERTGFPITRVEIGNLNFLRDSVEIKVFYDASSLKHTHISFAQSDILNPSED